MYTKYNSQGLEILAFPSNQFGGQEPGSAAQIQDFCEKNHGVTFPLMEKGDVNGKVSVFSRSGQDSGSVLAGVRQVLPSLPARSTRAKQSATTTPSRQEVADAGIYSPE